MTILIADDDAVSRKLLQKMLERSGFEVICVADGEAATACLLAPNGPRLAILDWIMPGGDGPTVCRTVRACTGIPYVYILLLTSREAIEDVVEGFDAGADDYLTKPYRPDELNVRLRVGQRLLKLQDDLIYEALHDTLTKLPNRAFFVKRLSRSVSLARQRNDYRFTLLFIDIDRFKMINDSLGHLAGDEIMRTVAQRLLLAVRTEATEAGHRNARGTPGDVVARIGGDEFVILLDDFADVQDGIRVAKRILTVLEASIDIDGHEVFITASIGISSSQGASTCSAEILRGADSAMYRAKLLGKARYEVDTMSQHAMVAERIRLEGDLRRAIENKELQVHYQPLVRLSDSHITGFEALARWHHPQLGQISPQVFIPIAEESGYILAIGAWILEEACRQVQEWNIVFPSTRPTVAVNISPAQYCEEDLMSKVQAVLERTGLEASSLQLEVTENLTMQNVQQAADILLQIQKIGVSISLDDFGTGYSALGYLLRFPINTLKVDRSFVAGIETNSQRASIVQTIITLGHNLGMKVVAEGIENLEQYDLLCSWKCDFGQGYFFSRAVDATEATIMLDEQRIGNRVQSSRLLLSLAPEHVGLLAGGEFTLKQCA